MKIASWNVNSIRARLEHTLDWLDKEKPDVLCLQEVKVKDEQFPIELFKEKGFNVYTFGQPAYNGVALITPHTMTDIQKGFIEPAEGRFDTQKRFIAGSLNGVRIINVYAPNGDNPDSDKFAYKEDWYKHLRYEFDTYYNTQDPVLICGDFNIAPEERDVHDPEAMLGKCGFHPLEHEWFANLMDWGFVDAFRIHNTTDELLFSWWDYRQNSFQRNKGMRIDGILVTPPLAQKCTACYIDKSPRTLERPSDHTPIVAEFAV